MEQAPATKMNRTNVQKRNSGRIARDAYEYEARCYFESIGEPPKLFVEVRKVAEPYVYLDLRNLIVLLIYETFGLDKWVQLCVVSKHHSNPDKECQTDKSTLLRLKSSISFQQTTTFLTENITKCNDDQSIDDIYNGSRKHPSITVADKKLIICGISSVIRFMIKYTCVMLKKDKDNLNNVDDKGQTDLSVKLKEYLGYRGGCLQACAESSIWTKFCEVDMISAANEITSIFESRFKELDISVTENKERELKIPESLIRFEHHLSLPVKVHNYRKVVQDIRKNERPVSDTDQLCNDVKDISISDLKHEYAEGPTLLLSDLILYPSVHFCLLLLGRKTFERLLPLSLKWYDKVDQHLHVPTEADVSCGGGVERESGIIWTASEVPVQSLYSRDPNRYKSSLRQFTRQYEIDEALEILHSQKIIPLEVSEVDPQFDWSKIPLLAHPEGGSLPVSRQNRKCEQLASMAYYALKVHSEKQQQCNYSPDKRFRIVDFCSGGGHLGILIAWLLPKCEVVLVENKDESLRRAQERVQGLGLSNVFFYESNLDYFESGFDLGMALHACGTATDLVLGKCIEANASFVCCPCCYGAMQENHVLNYPRSSSFLKAKLPLRHYFILCHASDHTHDEAHEKTNQGKQCMALIDTDRCLYAQDNCYDVKLCKIVPGTASPKNHILVGISSIK